MSNRKDVLFLCQFFYPEHNSSATLPFDTARYLAKNGLAVDVICGCPKEYSDGKRVPRKEEKDGVNIRRIGYIQLKRHRSVGRLINYFSFTASAMMRLFKLRRYKSVVVYSNPPILPIVAVFGKLLFKTKIVFVAYDIYPEVAYASKSVREGSLIDKGMRMINRMLFKRVDRVVALTDEMREFLVENRKPVTAEQVVTVANWAHENKIEPDDEAFARFGYSRDDFIVAYFGNMGICQEMQTLADAALKMQKREDVKFFFVGHGCKKDALEAFFNKNGCDNVKMYGFLTGKDFEQAVSVASCCVVSLESGLRGMCAPSKFYSYLQGGKPVLAIVEEGSYLEKEVEDNKLGRAVTIGDVDGLIGAISSLASNREESAKMGARSGRRYEENYSMDIALEKYLEIIKSL